MQPEKNKLAIFATLFPAGFWLVLFMVIPLGIILLFSLGSRDANGQIQLGFSLHNYSRFFAGPYLNCLWRSIELASTTTLACLFIGFPVAYWLALCVDRKRQNFFMMLLTIPLSISFLLRIYAWIVILRPTGVLSHLLASFGIDNPPIVLYTPWAVLLGMTYNYLPFMILPLYAALEKLDHRLLEAAVDLGARQWTVLTKIVLPMTSRGIVAGVVMVFVPSLGDYVTPDLMGGAKNMYIGSLIQNQFLSVRDWAFGCAVSTILLVLVSGAVWVQMKFGERPSAAH